MTSSAERESPTGFAVWIAPFFTIIATAVLFHLRRHDDNSLASWNMIFLSGVDPVRLFIALSAALLLVPLFSRSRIPIPARAHPFLLFAASAAMAAACWSIPEVNIDASRYFIQAKYLELYGVPFFFKEWGKEIAAWTDLPAIPFLYGLIFRLFGEARVHTQLFTAILFGLTTVQTWLIGKMLWNESTGLIGGVLLLGMPYLIMMTPLMLVDVPTMFFFTLSVVLFLRTIKTDRTGWAAAAAVAAAVTVFCKYSALFLLSVLPLISVVYYLEDRGNRRSILKNTGIVLVLFLLLTGTALILSHDVVAEQIRLLLAYQKPGLGRWSESFTSTFLFQMSPLISITALGSIIVAAVKKDPKYLVIAWLPLLIVLFQIRRIRYTLPAFPMIALMAAYALTALRDRSVVRSAVSCAAASALALCFFAYIPYLKHLSAANLQEAGAFLDTLKTDVVELVTLPERDYPINPAIAAPLLDLFTKKKIIFSYEPGASSPDVDVNISPFRFSWEYRNPSFYLPDAASIAGEKAVVVVSGRVRDVVPRPLRYGGGAYTGFKRFSTACPYYEYHTLVTVFW